MNTKAILFLNGNINIQFCTTDIQFHYNTLPIYCSDGAYNKIVSKTLKDKIVAVVGDGDSINEKINNKYIIFADQNYTDCEKILKYMVKKSYSEIFIYGAGGNEMDHYLGNISAIIKYENKIKFKFIDEYGYSLFLQPKIMIHNTKNKMVSIIPICKLQNVHSTGLKFELKSKDLKLGIYISIRNYAIKNKITIDFKQGKGMIFISHKKYHICNL